MKSPLRWIGALVVGVVLAGMLYRFAGSLGQRAEDADQPVVRVVHTHLQSGLREAFDAIARDYEARHPGVRIELIAVPERLYRVWLETKLHEGLAPDVVQLRDMGNERVLRAFVPLGALVDEENPYNEGTPLAGLPWRETFVDGLTTDPAYSANMLNVFGIPYTLSTQRLVINLDLLQEITGELTLPADWTQFVALCERVRAFAATHRPGVVPLALASTHAETLVDEAVGSRAQRLGLALAQAHRLEVFGTDLLVRYLQGQWTFDHPDLRTGLDLARQILLWAQPGHLQMQLADVQFLFLQGRALMTLSTSANLTSLSAQATFPLGAFALPWPAPDHPVYGAGHLGLVHEGAAGGMMAFGLTRSSRHPDVAVDFLRFLTSHASAQKFADLSAWLPAVTSVRPTAALEPFIPRTRGFANLPPLAAGNDTRQLFRSSLHHLSRTDGGTDAFVQAIGPRYAAAAAADLRRATREILHNAMMYDPVLGALWEQESRAPDADGSRAERLREVAEAQAFQEESMYLRLFEAGQRP